FDFDAETGSGGKNKRESKATGQTFEYLYSTSFDEVVYSPLSKESTTTTYTTRVNKSDPRPIAALHLHYRPEKWILDQGFSDVYEEENVFEGIEYSELFETESDKMIQDIEMRLEDEVASAASSTNVGISRNFDSSEVSVDNNSNPNINESIKGDSNKSYKNSFKSSSKFHKKTNNSDSINTVKYSPQSTIIVTATSTTCDTFDLSDGNKAMADSLNFDDEYLYYIMKSTVEEGTNIPSNCNVESSKDKEILHSELEEGEIPENYDTESSELEEGEIPRNYDVESSSNDNYRVDKKAMKDRNENLGESCRKRNKRDDDAIDLNSSGKTCDELNDGDRSVKRSRNSGGRIDEEMKECDVLDDFFTKAPIKKVGYNNYTKGNRNRKLQPQIISNGDECNEKERSIPESSRQFIQMDNKSKKPSVGVAEIPHGSKQNLSRNSPPQKEANANCFDSGVEETTHDKKPIPNNLWKLLSRKKFEARATEISRYNHSQSQVTETFEDNYEVQNGYPRNNQSMRFNVDSPKSCTLDLSSLSDKIGYYTIKKRKHVVDKMDVTDISNREERCVKKEHEIKVKKEFGIEERSSTTKKMNEDPGNKREENPKRRKFYAIVSGDISDSFLG
ncbi:10051_t:CDS:2, partial [Acaulospora colombiana]